MLAVRYDEPSAALLGVHSNTPTADEDFEQFLAAIEHITRCAKGMVPAFVLAVEPGQSPPNAKWRTRIAKLKYRTGPCRAVLVSDSLVYRGILTALDWIHPPTYNQRIVALGTLNQARVWLESECNRKFEVLHRLHAEASRSAARGAGRVVRAQSP